MKPAAQLARRNHAVIARNAFIILKPIIEEGFRRGVDSAESSAPYELPDRSVGVVGNPNPLESRSWQDLRREIYGGSNA